MPSKLSLRYCRTQFVDEPFFFNNITTSYNVPRTFSPKTYERRRWKRSRRPLGVVAGTIEGKCSLLVDSRRVPYKNKLRKTREKNFVGKKRDNIDRRTSKRNRIAYPNYRVIFKWLFSFFFLPFFISVNGYYYFDCHSLARTSLLTSLLSCTSISGYKGELPENLVVYYSDIVIISCILSYFIRSMVMWANRVMNSVFSRGTNNFSTTQPWL